MQGTAPDKTQTTPLKELVCPACGQTVPVQLGNYMVEHFYFIPHTTKGGEPCPKGRCHTGISLMNFD